MQLTTLLPLLAPIVVSGIATDDAPPPRPAPFFTPCPNAVLEALEPPTPFPDSAPPDGPYGRLMPHNTGLPLGIGFLRSDAGEHYWEWHRHIRLPLFRRPGTTPFAWIADGWLVDLEGESWHPFGTSGLVETEYESASAIVYEMRPDGWLRLRYLSGENGVAWTHECFFDRGEDTVSVTTWEERLTSDQISPLYFRNEVRHALRREPAVDADRLRWIPADPGEYHLQPLEIRGDWMRVRVTQPSDYCVGPDGPPTKRYEGWVRWRDDEVGPWVWYYTRGC